MATGMGLTKRVIAFNLAALDMAAWPAYAVREFFSYEGVRRGCVVSSFLLGMPAALGVSTAFSLAPEAGGMPGDIAAFGAAVSYAASWTAAAAMMKMDYPGEKYPLRQRFLKHCGLDKKTRGSRTLARWQKATDAQPGYDMPSRKPYVPPGF
jgi:hypothetical protein